MAFLQVLWLLPQSKETHIKLTISPNAQLANRSDEEDMKSSSSNNNN